MLDLILKNSKITIDDLKPFAILSLENIKWEIIKYSLISNCLKNRILKIEDMAVVFTKDVGTKRKISEMDIEK